MAEIYGLIGQAMREIGAIGKDSKNQQQGFMYRGIDAVYNALNPVMAKLGLFICPEVLDQTREERQTANGRNLIYSVMTIKYTIYAPDGSSVSCVVVGEGMDSGDKASNKAMSVAMKYAAFQLFMIPTEEMKDPDAETHEVKPKANLAARVAQVTKTETVPQTTAPVLEYLARERESLRVMREIGKAENNALFRAQLETLTANGLAPKKPLQEFTMDEAAALIDAMYKRFDPKGVTLNAG